MAKFKGVRPRNKDEKDFERDVRKEYLRPLMEAVAASLSGLTGEDHPQVWIAAVNIAISRWLVEAVYTHDPKLVDVVRDWANGLDRYHEAQFVRDFFRVAKVDLSSVVRGSTIIGETLDVHISNSVDLIRTIPKRYNEDLVKNYLKEEYRKAQRKAPLDLAEQEKVLKGIYRDTSKTAGYNVRRIVRDQSNKLTGELSRARQTAVGVREYEWQTSKDERVRKSHKPLDGYPFPWAGDGPDPDGNHPGQAIQCRCIAIPIISIDDVRQRVGVY